jgi:hypothetical protein
MEFEVPEESDYHNVRSLNRGFLELIRSSAVEHRLPQSLAVQISVLSAPQRERLASTPYLLFSLRERDHQYWENLQTQRFERDLFDLAPSPVDDYGRLLSASLGFAWQLAQRNAYAARLIFGATQHWCELIGDMTFYRLLAVAGTRDDIIMLRYSGHHELWSKLLDAGVSRENQVREASQIATLQAGLTGAEVATGTAWAIAACKRKSARLRVADDSDHE